MCGGVTLQGGGVPWTKRHKTGRSGPQNGQDVTQPPRQQENHKKNTLLVNHVINLGGL
jgi:hypothetical protein